MQQNTPLENDLDIGHSFAWQTVKKKDQNSVKTSIQVSLVTYRVTLQENTL